MKRRLFEAAACRAARATISAYKNVMELVVDFFAHVKQGRMGDWETHSLGARSCGTYGMRAC